MFSRKIEAGIFVPLFSFANFGEMQKAATFSSSRCDCFSFSFPDFTTLNYLHFLSLKHVVKVQIKKSGSPIDSGKRKLPSVTVRHFVVKNVYLCSLMWKMNLSLLEEVGKL